jgi:hypothetical protein
MKPKPQSLYGLVQECKSLVNLTQLHQVETGRTDCKAWRMLKKHIRKHWACVSMAELSSWLHTPGLNYLDVVRLVYDRHKESEVRDV